MVEHRPDEPSQPTNDADLSAVEAVVRPVLAAHAVDLFDMSLRIERGGWVLRVVLDVEASREPGAAVSVEQCADVSRDLSTALDVADLIPQAYTLEVSSPGIERPLRHEQDYQRFVGHPAKIMLVDPLPNGEKVIRGTLQGVQDHHVVVERDGQTSSYPLAGIKRAHLVFELPAQPKKSSSKKKKRAAKGR